MGSKTQRLSGASLALRAIVRAGKGERKIGNRHALVIITCPQVLEQMG